MKFTSPIFNKIVEQQKIYLENQTKKESLLRMINESEIAEVVYNSNAIENSTVTLRETEQILLELECKRRISLREIFEAKNLARVITFIHASKEKTMISKKLMLILHSLLMINIEDSIAGRFRSLGEYVRVGSHIAPPPEHIEPLIQEAFVELCNGNEQHIISKITKFHLEFERIHPFNDGNGRIGRVLVNYALLQHHFPPITFFNKDKQDYYQAFREYDENRSIDRMEKIISLLVCESLHKRNAYLLNKMILPIADFARKEKINLSSILNAARRQTVPAFREKGVWKIGIDVVKIAQ